MELELLRYSDNGDSTTGLLFVDNEFECYTLEDEARDVKVMGETRIPEGKYIIKERKEITPLTEKYRSLKNKFGNKIYPYFMWHLEICDIPNFTGVYIHPGNRDEHTAGCLLVGDSINNNTVDEAFLGNSRNAYKRLYKKIMHELSIGQEVKLNID